MSKQELLQTINEFVNRIARSKGSRIISISEDTLMLGGDLNMDSLDLAALIVELELSTNKDPFKEGFVNFRTAGELADLYTQS
jgi:acyl carrier protein